MVYMKPNQVWGGSPTMKTLEDLGFGYRGKDLPKMFAFRSYRDNEIEPFIPVEPSADVLDKFSSLNREIKQKFGIETDENAKYLDFDNYYDSIFGFTKVLRDHPELQPFAKTIKIDESLGTRSLMQINNRGELKMNPRYFGANTKHNLKIAIEESIRNGDVVRNFTLKSAGYHEAGHLFVDLYSHNNPDIKNPATKIVTQAMKNLNQSRTQRGWKVSNRQLETGKISNRAIN